MGDILLLISLLAIVKLFLEEAQWRSLWVRLVHALLMGGFVCTIHPYCLGISKLTLDKWLASPTTLQNASLLVIADLICCLLLVTVREVKWPDRAYVRYYGIGRAVGNMLHLLVPYLPPLLALPALFYLRVVLLFELTGVSFVGVTAVLALFAMLLVLLAPFLGRWLQFSVELMGEFSLLLSLATLTVVVGAGVVTIRPESYVLSDIDPSVFYIILLLFVGAFFGHLWHTFQYKSQKRNNKR